MSSAETSGNNVVKSGFKRHRKVLKDNILGITKADIRRLARRGGITRMSAEVNDLAREIIRSDLMDLVSDAITYTTHANRKTIVALDVVYALKRQGRQLYGFGG
ncbi:Oidioi.mRNA.OKI2018_I69.chr2.g7160.t1.cds [Oikopleura dioica]|uniref:Histone H4 n=1 Tax=Oikopleura dioica TaxID=34765 RepID=A0ABN7T5Y0_OIKDI|nr:Oidioi.mRNA.OKI2018_I69.chr2.g7160.t1.cds [Oikopleura dioica]